MRLLKTERPGARAGCYVANVSYSEGGDFGALWDSERRDIPLFAPRGLRFRPCEGDSLLMLRGEGQDVCAGALFSPAGLAPGEIECRGPRGSYILFKGNGDIVINGLRVDLQGKLHAAPGV